MSEWISVNDRLPELWTEVLVYLRPVSKRSKHRKYSVSYLGDYMETGRRWEIEWDSAYTVTHWMPLPEPPAQEDVTTR